MSMFLAILIFVVGLALIVKGGDAFVDAATWIAKVSGIPTFIVGATIVSLATTLPEIGAFAMLLLALSTLSTIKITNRTINTTLPSHFNCPV